NGAAHARCAKLNDQEKSSRSALMRALVRFAPNRPRRGPELSTEEQMHLNKLSALATIATLIFPPIANAQTTIRIGVLTDMSGLYSDFSGAGSLEAAKMAAEDFIAANPDLKVEVVSADHQNKPDIAASIARKWLENDGVDAIADVATSSASLAVSHI